MVFEEKKLVLVSQVDTIKKTNKRRIYMCFATCEDKEYEFFIYHDIKANDYIFYYMNGIKPNYSCFEREVLDSGLII